jgi:hypothetical protein
MTAHEFLGQLTEKGLHVTVEPGGVLAIRPARLLTLEGRVLARVLKPDLVRELSPAPLIRDVIELRAAYRDCFTLTAAEADGQPVAPAEGEALYQAITKLTDDVGPAYAEVLLREERRRFEKETGGCGFCGGLPYH